MPPRGGKASAAMQAKLVGKTFYKTFEGYGRFKGRVTGFADALPVEILQNTISDRVALHCTATARVLIPAECSAIS